MLMDSVLSVHSAACSISPQRRVSFRLLMDSAADTFDDDANGYPFLNIRYFSTHHSVWHSALYAAYPTDAVVALLLMRLPPESILFAFL